MTSKMQPNFRFNLGDEVKDKITGFAGVIYGRTQWYNGCNRYCIWSRKLNPEDGKPVENHFDEEQLELVKAVTEKTSPTKPLEERTGGPFDSPTRPTASR